MVVTSSKSRVQKQKKLEILKTRISELQSQIDRVENIGRREEEKLLTRRKILLGSFILKKHDNDYQAIFSDIPQNELDMFLTRNIDRVLFEFERLIDVPADCHEGKNLLQNGGAEFAFYKNNDKKIERWKVHDENFEELKEKIDKILQAAKQQKLESGIIKTTTTKTNEHDDGVAEHENDVNENAELHDRIDRKEEAVSSSIFSSLPG